MSVKKPAKLARVWEKVYGEKMPDYLFFDELKRLNKNYFNLAQLLRDGLTTDKYRGRVYIDAYEVAACCENEGTVDPMEIFESCCDEISIVDTKEAIKYLQKIIDSIEKYPLLLFNWDEEGVSAGEEVVPSAREEEFFIKELERINKEDVEERNIHSLFKRAEEKFGKEQLADKLEKILKRG